jgi:hypothetical protein
MSISIWMYVYLYQYQKTPLHLAAEKGHGKIVETLVEAKADLCAQDEVSVLKETSLNADRGMRRSRRVAWCRVVQQCVLCWYEDECCLSNSMSRRE